MKLKHLAYAIIWTVIISSAYTWINYFTNDQDKFQRLSYEEQMDQLTEKCKDGDLKACRTVYARAPEHSKWERAAKAQLGIPLNTSRDNGQDDPIDDREHDDGTPSNKAGGGFNTGTYQEDIDERNNGIPDGWTHGDLDDDGVNNANEYGTDWNSHPLNEHPIEPHSHD